MTRSLVTVGRDGKRSILGLSVQFSEAETHWRSFFQSLVDRGKALTGPEAFGGGKVNIKRVHRIWKEAHMQVPQK